MNNQNQPCKNIQEDILGANILGARPKGEVGLRVEVVRSPCGWSGVSRESREEGRGQSRASCRAELGFYPKHHGKSSGA